MLTKASEICCGTTFIDLDHLAVIEKKVRTITETNELSDLLNGVTMTPEDSPVKYKSDEYIAIACDLADVSALQDTMNTVVDFTNSETLVIAEVSLAYMVPEAADRLIGWAESLGNGRRDCLKLRERADMILF